MIFWVILIYVRLLWFNTHLNYIFYIKSFLFDTFKVQNIERQPKVLKLILSSFLNLQEHQTESTLFWHTKKSHFFS